MTRWGVAHLGPDVPWHFTAFHPDYKMLDRPSTSPERLSIAREIAMKNGVRYAYTGNVHDERGESTYCHACRKRLIGRDWHRITDWNLSNKGLCRFCGVRCEGSFDVRPGNWASPPQPVPLGNLSPGDDERS